MAKPEIRINAEARMTKGAVGGKTHFARVLHLLQITENCLMLVLGGDEVNGFRLVHRRVGVVHWIWERKTGTERGRGGLGAGTRLSISTSFY